jgi:hypothetical protein
MQKLVKLFGSKNFGQERLRSVWRICNHLTGYEFSRIVEEMVDNFRYAPLPKDFREACQRRGRFRAEEGESDVTKCLRCNDGGLLEAHNDELNFTAFVRCNCVVGEESQWKNQLPMVTAEIEKSHRVETIDSKLWKPTKKENIWVKAQKWKAQIELSRGYWE